jgi:SAM-dependent methyltransferase
MIEEIKKDPRSFWNNRYQQGETGWDIGEPSTPLKEYFDQITDKSLRILIPGAGNAWEAEYAWKQGFSGVEVVDIAPEAVAAFKQRVPDFPASQLHLLDFFELDRQYDLVIEQTFFCALDPALRQRYAEKMHEILASGGKLVGVMFDAPMNEDRPPFGGSSADYMELFSSHFQEVNISPCYNSIQPRAGREVFVKIRK